MPGPLHGVRVVELGVWIAGPAASGVLGDWGADIVKIEPLSGDPSRLFRRMLSLTRDDNPIFELDNRNKRGIALDVSTPGGRAIVLDLVREADVFVTNARAESVARAGLDHCARSIRASCTGRSPATDSKAPKPIGPGSTSPRTGPDRVWLICTLPTTVNHRSYVEVWAITPRVSLSPVRSRPHCSIASEPVRVRWCRRRSSARACTRSGTT